MKSFLASLIPKFVWEGKRTREQDNDGAGQASDQRTEAIPRRSCSGVDPLEPLPLNVESSRKPHSFSCATDHADNEADAYEPVRKRSRGERQRSASAQPDGRQTVSSNQQNPDCFPPEIDSASPSPEDAMQSGHENRATAQRQLHFATPIKSTESHQPDVDPTYTSARQDALHAVALRHQQHTAAGPHDDAEQRLGIRLARPTAFRDQNGPLTPARQNVGPRYESRSAQVTIGLGRGGLSSGRSRASPLPTYRPSPPSASIYDGGLRPPARAALTSPARLHELLNPGNDAARTPSLSGALFLESRALQPLQLPADAPNADVEILSVERGSQPRFSTEQDRRLREQAERFKQLDAEWKQRAKDSSYEAELRYERQKRELLEFALAAEAGRRELLERLREVTLAEESPARSEGVQEESGVIDIEESEEEHEAEDGGLAAESRELSAEEQEEYQALLDIGVPTAEICSHAAANLVLKASDFETFGPHGWLSDECINMYMALLQDRDSRFREQNVKAPRVWFCNTFFMGKLYLDSNSFNFAGVQRWTTPKRLKKLGLPYSNVFELDKVVVPCHLGNHWTCACVNFRNKQLEYYDSLGGRHNEVLESLGKWVEMEYKHKLSNEAPPEMQATQWDRVVNPQGTPRQQNGWDCGVFTLMCAAYISRDRPFDYDQEDVHYYFRAKCALQCKRQLVE